jgi:hypothetical protein
MHPEPVTAVDKGTYVLVEFSGAFSLEAGKRCVDEMDAACEEYGRPKVLLDCRGLTGNMDVFDRFKVTVYGTSHPRHFRRLALLALEEMLLHDRFVENVAVNRGMDLKIFTDIHEAEQWLTKSGVDADGTK